MGNKDSFAGRGPFETTESGHIADPQLTKLSNFRAFAPLRQEIKAVVKPVEITQAQFDQIRELINEVAELSVEFPCVKPRPEATFYEGVLLRRAGMVTIKTRCFFGSRVSTA